MKIDVKHIDTGIYVLNEDNKFECIHDEVSITKDVDGEYATCDHCNADLSVEFDWDNHYESKADSRSNL